MCYEILRFGAGGPVEGVGPSGEPPDPLLVRTRLEAGLHLGLPRVGAVRREPVPHGGVGLLLDRHLLGDGKTFGQHLGLFHGLVERLLRACRGRRGPLGLTGGAARLVSEYRPDANIVCLTTNEVTFRRLALFWGVTPVLVSPSASTEELVDRVEATLIERNLALPGENVLITMAVPVGGGMQTNVLKIHQIQH